MTARYQTALGKMIGHWQFDEEPLSPPDCEIIRPRTAPHNAMETYALAACVTILGFLVCQDILDKVLEMAGFFKFFASTLLTTFLLQALTVSLLPTGRKIGNAMLFALTAYLLAFQTLNPVTLTWLAMCSLNCICWLFQRISSLK